MALPLILISIGTIVAFVLSVVVGADLLVIGGGLMVAGALGFIGILMTDVARGLWDPRTR